MNGEEQQTRLYFFQTTREDGTMVMGWQTGYEAVAAELLTGGVPA